MNYKEYPTVKTQPKRKVRKTMRKAISRENSLMKKGKAIQEVKKAS